jgi:LysM repeat protein
MVFVFAASGFGAYAQTNETNDFKDVLLDGKPAKLNLVTGEITLTNGEIATSREAKKIKDSVLENRTEIKTNLITDMLASEMSQNDVVKDSVAIEVEILDDPSLTSETHKSKLSNNSQEIKSFISPENQQPAKALVSINPYLEGQSKNNSNDYHMVQKGETLYALSKRYNTSLTQLKIANNLETTLIKAGETLRVRNFEYSDELSETVWVVSKGDTLYSIAKQHNTTVEDLKNLNDLSSNLIKVGQKLQVNQNSTLSKK